MTTANLAVWVTSRQERCGTLAQWRFTMPDPRVASRQWLLDRLPPDLRDAATVRDMRHLPPILEWGHKLRLVLATPHVVHAYAGRYQWEFNLGMGLTEITDLIRQTLEER